MGVVLVTQPGGRDGARPAPQMFVSGTPVEKTSDSPESLRANFRFAKGHVVTFQVMRRVGEDQYVSVANFAGFAVAPDEERGRFSLTLSPDQSGSSINPLVWQLSGIHLKALIELLRRVALRILGTTYHHWRKVDSIKRFARLAVPHRQIQVEVDVRRPNVIWDLVPPQQPNNAAHVFHGLMCVTSVVVHDLVLVMSPLQYLTFS